LRRLYIAGLITASIMVLAAVVGFLIGPGLAHPANLNPERLPQTVAMLARTHATREDFVVRAPDGAMLRGWKIRPATLSGDWVLLFHGISDNRTGTLGAADFLLRHGYSVVMMDARAHGKSGGDFSTYGWQERFDTVAITQALLATEHVRHLYALGVSLGAVIALDSAAVEPRIEAVAAEDSFSSLHEVAFDYAGLWISPWLGRTLFRPATFFALRRLSQTAHFDPAEASPEKAVAQRAFPVLLICGTRDRQIPCRHDELIYRAARGPKQLWVVRGAGHAGAFGTAPREYEERVLKFFQDNSLSS